MLLSKIRKINLREDKKEEYQHSQTSVIETEYTLKHESSTPEQPLNF